MAINIEITSDDTIEYGGKQYRPVAIRLAEEGEWYLENDRTPKQSDRNFMHYPAVILEEVIPPYRTPTDEDAKQRPIAEFWGIGESPDDSKEGTLLGVLDRKLRPFVGVINGRVSARQHCRIPNEGAAK